MVIDAAARFVRPAKAGLSCHPLGGAKQNLKQLFHRMDNMS
jgi:hypothetical protein